MKRALDDKIRYLSYICVTDPSSDKQVCISVEACIFLIQATTRLATVRLL